MESIKDKNEDRPESSFPTRDITNPKMSIENLFTVLCELRYDTFPSWLISIRAHKVRKVLLINTFVQLK
jgi:hypothetical protein